MPDRLSERERRLVVNAIAGTAFMMLDLSRRFPTNVHARTKGALIALEEIVPMLTNGDATATTEVVNRLAEAVSGQQAHAGLVKASPIIRPH